MKDNDITLNADDILTLVKCDFDRQYPGRIESLMFEHSTFNHEIKIKLSTIEMVSQVDEESRKKLLETPLEDLDMSVGLYNLLKSINIKTLGEIRNYSAKELMEYRNSSKKRMIELRDKILKPKNLHLKGDPQ